MGVQKKTRKFGAVKRVISQRDARVKKNIMKNESEEKKKKEQGDNVIREVYVQLCSFHDVSGNILTSSQSTSP
jgi:hypothetical protein